MAQLLTLLLLLLLSVHADRRPPRNVRVRVRRVGLRQLQLQSLELAGRLRREERVLDAGVVSVRLRWGRWRDGQGKIRIWIRICRQNQIATGDLQLRQRRRGSGGMADMYLRLGRNGARRQRTCNAQRLRLRRGAHLQLLLGFVFVVGETPSGGESSVSRPPRCRASSLHLGAASISGPAPSRSRHCVYLG